MKLRENVPKVYDENYPLNFKEQTTIIELSFINYELLDQIRMPMVVELPDRDELVACFQRCVGACILTFIKEGLLTDEFYEAHQNILDEQHGIKPDVVLGIMGVSDLAYDIHRMMSQYMVVMGHEKRIIPREDALYGNQKYFARKCIFE